MARRRLQITDQMMGCLRYRHAMRPTGTMHRRRNPHSMAYGTEVELYCDYCGSYGYDVYNSLGRRDQARQYDYSPAYEAALELMRGSGLDRNTDITLEVLRRIRANQDFRAYEGEVVWIEGDEDGEVGNVVPIRSRSA